MPETTSRTRRSDRLLSTLADYERLLVVTHDNPDPDAIASGWAVLCLIEERLGRPARLIGGGAIVRAENKHMVELLNPPIELVDEIEITADTGTVLVDCQMGASNHLLTRESIPPVAVIDHHANGHDALRLAFRDVRARVAASASITGSYLREQGIDPGPKLATALLYAIRTETCGYETHHSRVDRSILVWLTKSADPALLAEIENAPLSRDYFADLALAVQNTFLYGDTALCLLPRAAGAEIVGEVADLLIRCESVHRVLCGAVVGDDLLLSARTERHDEHAAKLLRETLGDLGGCGGHAHRAGGKIPGAARGMKIGEELQELLRTRWLAACHIDRRRGTRLVPRREIVEHL